MHHLFIAIIMNVDPRIDELLQITKDTNHMVHKMRRAQLWGRFYQIVWWGAIFAVSGAAYYYYAQPYIDKLEQLYMQVQQSSAQAQGVSTQLSSFLSNQQAQGVGSQISSFFGNWLPHATTTTPVK